MWTCVITGLWINKNLILQFIYIWICNQIFCRQQNYVTSYSVKSCIYVAKNEAIAWKRYCWRSHFRMKRECDILSFLEEPMEIFYKLNINKLNPHPPQPQTGPKHGYLSSFSLRGDIHTHFAMLNVNLRLMGGGWRFNLLTLSIRQIDTYQFFIGSPKSKEMQCSH